MLIFCFWYLHVLREKKAILLIIIISSAWQMVIFVIFSSIVQRRQWTVFLTKFLITIIENIELYKSFASPHLISCDFLILLDQILIFQQANLVFSFFWCFVLCDVLRELAFLAWPVFAWPISKNARLKMHQNSFASYFFRIFSRCLIVCSRKIHKFMPRLEN